ncbi:MAG: NUDIX hydrolase [Planctomycetota bacterium]
MHDPESWTPGEKVELLRTRILTVHQQRFEYGADPSRSGDFVIIDCPDWVNIAAFTAESDPRLVMVEQYRYGTREVTLELPGGVIDAGETALTAGPRELLEETGYSGREPRPVGTVDANPAIMSNRSHAVLIEGCEKVREPQPDAHEALRVRLVGLAEVAGLVRNGKITHPIVLSALLRLAVDERIPL